MPLNKANTRTFQRKLYAGQLQTITLLKRNNDQQEGTVVAHLIFDCRRGIINKTGQPIQKSMTSNHIATWHIPVSELERVGIKYINVLDRIVDEENDYWQPEADTYIDVKLFKNWTNIHCERVNPPNVGS